MAGVSARSVWSGSISFGMVSLPIRLYTAQDEGGGLAFKQVCRKHGTLVKQPKRCDFDGHDVLQAEIVKGYEYGDTLIQIEPDELTKLPLASNKELAITDFVPVAQVTDPGMVKATYYVCPTEVGRRAYALLRDALHQTGRAGVGKIAMRGGREQLAAILSDGAQLRLVLLLWPDEIRSGEQFVDTETQVTTDEVVMAKRLVKALSSDFDSAKYHDDYRLAAMALIESKVGGMPPPSAPAKSSQEKVNTLMEALKQSLGAA